MRMAEIGIGDGIRLGRPCGWAVMLLAGMLLHCAAAESNLVGGSVALDTGSAYVWRGGTYNQSWILQPSGEVHVGPVFAGAWGNLDINSYENKLEEFVFSEIRLFAGLRADVARWTLEAWYTEYPEKLRATGDPNPPREVVVPEQIPTPDTYEPDQEPPAALNPLEPRERYPFFEATDAREASLRIRHASRWMPELAVHRGLGGSLEDQTYVAGGVGYVYYRDPSWDMGIRGEVAYLDQPEGTSGFSHVEFVHFVRYKRVRASIHFVSALDSEILQDADIGGPYDTHEWAEVGYVIPF